MDASGKIVVVGEIRYEEEKVIIVDRPCHSSWCFNQLGFSPAGTAGADIRR